jgi:hypothetical protein
MTPLGYRWTEQQRDSEQVSKQASKQHGKREREGEKEKENRKMAKSTYKTRSIMNIVAKHILNAFHIALSLPPFTGN